MEKVKDATGIYKEAEDRLAAMIATRERKEEKQRAAAGERGSTSAKEKSAGAELKRKELQAAAADKRETEAQHDAQDATEKAEDAQAADQAEKQALTSKVQQDMDELKHNEAEIPTRK